MTNEELAEKIEVKANADVQAAILVLKQAINAAFRAFGVAVDNRHSPSFHGEAKVILALLASDDSKKRWPSAIWKRREAELLNDVLDTMNTLQKILLAKPPAEILGEPEVSEAPAE